jgi:cytochrome P450
VLAAAVIVGAVRARPNYGRSRRLPAGSLGLSESLDAIHDPDYYSRTAARLGPVFKMSQIHQPVVCITDLQTGLEFFRDNEDRLLQSEWAFNRLVPGGYLEYMNGDLHAQVRAMLAPSFTREVVAAARPVLTDVTRTQLAAMARASQSVIAVTSRPPGRHAVDQPATVVEFYDRAFGSDCT